MRHRARIVAALALTLALVGLLRPAAAAVTVTYGVVSWNPFHWVVMVGTAKGQFDKHGVTLDIPLTGSSGAAVQALIRT
jgi:ABC-type nitrate/sulfonate/bicarbonate transport system substrate-binding protein